MENWTGPKCNHKCLYKRKTDIHATQSHRGGGNMKTEQREMWRYWLWRLEWGSYKWWNDGRYQRLEETRNGFSHRAPGESMALLCQGRHLDFSSAHKDFGILAYRTVGGYIFVVLNQDVVICYSSHGKLIHMTGEFATVILTWSENSLGSVEAALAGKSRGLPSWSLRSLWTQRH